MWIFYVWCNFTFLTYGFICLENVSLSTYTVISLATDCELSNYNYIWKYPKLFQTKRIWFVLYNSKETLNWLLKHTNLKLKGNVKHLSKKAFFFFSYIFHFWILWRKFVTTQIWVKNIFPKLYMGEKHIKNFQENNFYKCCLFLVPFLKIEIF